MFPSQAQVIELQGVGQQFDIAPSPYRRGVSRKFHPQPNRWACWIYHDDGMGKSNKIFDASNNCPGPKSAGQIAHSGKSHLSL